MFEFRIIETADGNQIIDRSLKTPHSALTPLQMMEYVEMDNQLAFMDRLQRKSRKEADRRRKISRNPLWRIACLCGLVNLERA